MGCSGDAPTATQSYAANFKAAGNSGCYTVKFTSVSNLAAPPPVPPLPFAGVQMGDLEGTHTVTFFELKPQTGATQNLIGEATFNITGGIIDELVGESFTVSVKSRNVFNDDDLFANLSNLKARAISGVQKANLTGRGETALDFTVTISWNGVICP